MTLGIQFKLSPAVVDQMRALIGYVITIPAWIFAREMLGDGWRSPLLWVVRAVRDGHTGSPTIVVFALP